MRSRGAGELLAWALVPKAALILLLVAVGLRPGSDDRHVAPRAPGMPAAVWVLARGWDADAYQRIAVQGYYDEYSRNYPPGYPALIRLAALVAPSTQVAAVLVSNVAAVLAQLVFARLARRLAGPQGTGRPRSGPAGRRRRPRAAPRAWPWGAAGRHHDLGVRVAGQAVAAGHPARDGGAQRLESLGGPA